MMMRPEMMILIFQTSEISGTIGGHRSKSSTPMMWQSRGTTWFSRSSNQEFQSAMPRPRGGPTVVTGWRRGYSGHVRHIAHATPSPFSSLLVLCIPSSRGRKRSACPMLHSRILAKE